MSCLRGNSLARLFTSLVVTIFSLAPRPSLSQFAPYRAANLTTIVSPVDPKIKIAYKVPEGVCNTAFDYQQQYTGWVTVPGDSPTNLFFWFVAGRQPTSALTIWLNGGPGASSMFGFFTETGPCEVVEKGANRLDTVFRRWGWDRASNMLFIDQPNQVGFSYDVPTNGSTDLGSGKTFVPPQGVPKDQSPATFLNGTFSSSDAKNTANSTKVAGIAIWHMLQGFLDAFPEYNPPRNGSLGVNLFAESYGGKYGPVFAETWEEQNARHRNGSLANSTLEINLVSLGIVNGCVDDVIQHPHYTTMAVNNTYGLELLNPVRAKMANGTFYQRGGCRDLVLQCRNASSSLNPSPLTSPEAIDTLCRRATEACNNLIEPYFETGRSVYDIAHKSPASSPPNFYLEYLNSRPVQQAIGSVVNYTDVNPIVYNAFLATGDFVRDAMVPKLAALLGRGVRIGLIYGDRDYICNWFGGEAISLAIASSAGGVYATSFPSAGYAPIIVNDSYIGGVVRQFGNLSFSRIYQAGHFVPAYQPETAFQVFARIVTGTSVSTGAPIDLSSYNTSGSATASSSLSLPPSPTTTCWVRSMAGTCPSETVESILKGQGVIINGAWYAASGDWPGATETASSSGTSSTPTSSPTLTGLFTATATPSEDFAVSLSASASRSVLMGVLLWSLCFVI
ncbi:serine carboxypeptidase [Podospora aff. communis PSN243]|uniref:Carboxypeptidase n=1 Tax=Podospora aff. communis PSN243 TaxID=3040156 RepID=A0AAV9H298_9PEZI|nr:serine carboxypeptidase [Podospora aff. communis PSN243]